MKTPEFSLESLQSKNERKKKKTYLNYEKLNAHYVLKLPIFFVLMVGLLLNVLMYFLIRVFILIFEKLSFFVITKYKDFNRNTGNKHTTNENGKEIKETQKSILKTEKLMSQCKNYQDYLHYAYQMDVLTGRIIHMIENNDYMNSHDVNLLKKTTENIKNNIQNEDILHLLDDIKIATSPQFQGIFKEKYYCKTYSNPHVLVSEFIHYTCAGLDYIEQHIAQQKQQNMEYIYSHEYIWIKKCFKEIFQQWGNTALFLSGGAILGLHHFGVIEAFLNISIDVDYFKHVNKDFVQGESRNNEEIENNKSDENNHPNELWNNYEQTLLPQIICGTSAGSIIAAWVGSRTKEELLKEFNIGFIYDITACFSNDSFYSVLNIFKKGNVYDVDRFVKNMYGLFGDITFLEAYLKTNIVLNITVTRAECENYKFTCDGEGHIVLNYMNSPNVLIYSAVLASCSFPYLLQPFKLLEKKYHNESAYKLMAIKQVTHPKIFLCSRKKTSSDIMNSYFSTLSSKKSDCSPRGNSNSNNNTSSLDYLWNSEYTDENSFSSNHESPLMRKENAETAKEEENVEGEIQNIFEEKYTIINSTQFKNMYFHDGSLKSDIPARNLNQMFSVKYRIVSQVNPHVFPFIGLRIHGEAGKPIQWRGNKGYWRAGFLLSSMEILFKENMRYILRLMALLDLSPTIRGLNAGSVAMQTYNGDVTLHPRRLFIKHFKLISVSNNDDVEWYIHQGRQMTYPKLPLILSRMRIEKKLVKMKKVLF